MPARIDRLLQIAEGARACEMLAKLRMVWPRSCGKSCTLHGNEQMMTVPPS